MGLYSPAEISVLHIPVNQREPTSHSRRVPLRGSWCHCFLAIVLVSHSSLQETAKEEEILHEEQKERRGRRRKQN